MLPTWWQHWYPRQANTSNPGPGRRERARFRPRLELLESRLAPAGLTLQVTTALDKVDAGDSKLSLREAITKANNHVGRDSIILPAGTFKVLGLGDDANLTGDFDVTDSVTIRGAGAAATIIDGRHLDRAFHVFGTGPGSINVTLQRLAIRNGQANYGGGVLFGNANLKVLDSVITANQATENGAGISNALAPATGSLKLIRTTVSGNVAGGSGGGIYLQSAALSLKQCKVRLNNANVDGGGLGGGGTWHLNKSKVSGNTAGNEGGGISARYLYLNRSTVSGNEAASGGGISSTYATLTQSTVSGNNATGSGGGIGAFDVTLTQSTVSNNDAGSSGGGILVSTATLTNSTVSGNTAGGDGGGIKAYGAATLTSSTVSGNIAGGDGGGIKADTADLTNSTVRDNDAAGNGGGILAFEPLANSTVNLTNSIVRDNSAGDNGGGIFALVSATLFKSSVSGNSAITNGGGIVATEATLHSSTVSGNDAGGNGGGILAFETANLINSTVSGNSAGGNGGGIRAGAAMLLFVTITQNSALTGGGIYRVPGATGSFIVRNTIIAQNFAASLGTAPDVSGIFTSFGHNLIGINQGAEASFPVGNPNDAKDLVGSADDPIDPQLNPLANNGGSTKTHALRKASPAVNGGADPEGLTTDQRGGKFKRQVGLFVDIGSFERQ